MHDLTAGQNTASYSLTLCAKLQRCSSCVLLGAAVCGQLQVMESTAGATPKAGQPVNPPHQNSQPNPLGDTPTLATCVQSFVKALRLHTIACRAQGDAAAVLTRRRVLTGCRTAGASLRPTTRRARCQAPCDCATSPSSVGCSCNQHACPSWLSFCRHPPTDLPPSVRVEACFDEAQPMHRKPTLTSAVSCAALVHTANLVPPAAALCFCCSVLLLPAVWPNTICTQLKHPGNPLELSQGK